MVQGYIASSARVRARRTGAIETKAGGSDRHRIGDDRRVSGIVLATLLIVWMNAGIRLAFEGNAGPQYQLLALGVLLVFAALLNAFAQRRYGGAG